MENKISESCFYERCNCCNYDRCYKNCRKDCEKEQSKCEIMMSVATQEAGLAHILNAEGEKIQKSVQIARNVRELLDVNRSVVDTIDSVTRMELALLSKLNALRE